MPILFESTHLFNMLFILAPHILRTSRKKFGFSNKFCSITRLSGTFLNSIHSPLNRSKPEESRKTNQFPPKGTEARSQHGSRGRCPRFAPPSEVPTQYAPSGWSRKSSVRAGPGHWSGACPLFFVVPFRGDKCRPERGANEGLSPQKVNTEPLAKP